MPTNPLHLDVHDQIESAHTLASNFYTDPAILEAEKDRIFRRTWQFVGTLNTPCGEPGGARRTIADPETFFTVDVIGEPLVVVRDKQGTLRAFSNVCRHRAGPIACRQWLQKCSPLRLPWMDLHARWPLDRHSRRRRRRIFRSQHHGHGAAPPRDLGTTHLRQLRSQGRVAVRLSRQNSRTSPRLPVRGPANPSNAATTSSIAIGRCTLTTISRATTSPSRTPA